MTGPGKYDRLCTYVREEAKAAGACVMIFDGEYGSGFSAQLPEGAEQDIPDILRQMADQIERDAKNEE